MTAEEAEEWLRSAVVEANRRICDSIRLHEERRGMGTTLVAMVQSGRDAIVGHVGDSRLYLLRGGEFLRLTSDHSWVNEQVKLGLMNDDTAQRHPMRNIVTRALGSRPDVTVDLSTVEIEPGDVFLLCSDGLNTMLTDPQIQGILASRRHDPESACRELVREANAHGGEDNVTVVVACVVNTA
jgi:protein phosphatase